MAEIPYDRFDSLKSSFKDNEVVFYRIALGLSSIVLIPTIIALVIVSSRDPSCSGPQKPTKNYTQLMICGGHHFTKPQKIYNSCEFYYPDKPELNKIMSQSFSIPRYWHTSQIVDGKVYIVGGPDAAMKSTEIYDAQTETWTAGPDLNHGRFQAVSAVINDTMWVCGGQDEGANALLDSCEFLDQSMNRWLTHPEKMVHRLGCSGASIFDGYFYVLGGYEKGGEFSAKCEKMNLTTGNWSNVTPLPSKRDKLRAVDYNGTLVTCGGFRRPEYLNICERYLPEYDVWIPMPGMLDGLEDHLMVNFNGKLIVLGGYNKQIGDTNKVEIFDEQSKSWKYAKGLIEKRQQATVVML